MDGATPDVKAARFMLGANTPLGFVSRFDQLAETKKPWRLFVIKGGPGTGKSSMIKKVLLEFAGKSSDIQIMQCSSDINSFDGVCFGDLHIALADGTAPHVIEPKYPGAFESVVYLSDCWDETLLQSNREQIIQISKKNTQCHEHCCRFLNAAAALLGDTFNIALEATDHKKIQRYAGRLASLEMKQQGNSNPKESVRFLSAVTDNGHIILHDTAKTLCDKIYMIVDEYGAASRLLMSELRSKALAAGYDIITCCCPLSPFDKIDHIFIPSLRLGFMSNSRLMELDIDPYRTIQAKRFTNTDMIHGKKKRINFNRKASRQMLDQAALQMRLAKEFHDEIEKFYIAAMDFSKVEKKQRKLIDDIHRLLDANF